MAIWAMVGQNLLWDIMNVFVGSHCGTVGGYLGFCFLTKWIFLKVYSFLMKSWQWHITQSDHWDPPPILGLLFGVSLWVLCALQRLRPPCCARNYSIVPFTWAGLMPGHHWAGKICKGTAVLHQCCGPSILMSVGTPPKLRSNGIS